MKTSIDIHALRNGSTSSDRAILDLLHLEQLGMAPGVVAVRLLTALWNSSQPQVSRRMKAIGAMNLYHVRSGWGCYTLIQPGPQKPPLTSSERWDAVRQQLQQMEIVGDCSGAVLERLRWAHQQGLQSVGLQDITDHCLNQHGYSSKTVRNTLTNLVNERTIVRSGRGRYSLSPKQQQLQESVS